MVFIVSTLKKLPRFLMFVSIIIVVFLLGFLLVSCTAEPKAYSDVYLTEFNFNKSSPLYNNVKLSFSSSNSSGMADMSLRVGYLGICISMKDVNSCSTYNNLTWLSEFSGTSIVPTSSKTSGGTLDLAALARDFREVCYSNVVIAATVMSLILLVLIFWLIIPCAPGKLLGLKIVTFLSAIDALLWGLGAMLQHVATHAANKLVPSASMQIISAKIGTRAEAMSWTAFTFILLVCILGVFMFLSEMKQRRKQLDYPQKF